jgi:hypothetical protein
MTGHAPKTSSPSIARMPRLSRSTSGHCATTTGSVF